MADQMVTNPAEEQDQENHRAAAPPPQIWTPEGPRQAPRSRLKWFAILGGLIILAALIPLYLYYSVRESTDDAEIDGHIHAISPQVGGKVTQVNVDNNQYVTAGTVLVQIDPRDYETALAHAESDMNEQEALWHASEADVPVTSGTSASQLSGTEAQVLEVQADIAAAQKDAQAARAKLAAVQAALQESQANNQRASKDLERLRPLAAKDEISPQQFDAATATAASEAAAEQAARAAVTNAEAGVQAADSHVAMQQARLTQAQAVVRGAQTAPQQVAAMKARADSAKAKWEQAKATLAQAQLNLDYTTIKAPVSGIVGKKSVETGQTVQPGEPLLAIVPLDEIWVTANFKETQLRSMRVGQPVVISVDAYGGRKYQGHVDSIAAATGSTFSLLPPENASGNYVKVVQRVPVKIVLEKGQDTEHLLRPGMSVEPTVKTN